MRWQEIVGTITEVLRVTAARVVEATGQDFRVLALAGTVNGYGLGDTLNHPGSSVYCASALEKRAGLIIPDATRDARWHVSSSIDRDIMAYIGLPLHWPGGEIFGVIDILDSTAATDLTASYRLVAQFRSVIEDHLAEIAAQPRRTPAGSPAPMLVDLSLDNFRQLIEIAADDFFVHDDQGHILDVNEQACRSTGYTRDEFLARRIRDVAPTFDAAALDQMWSRSTPGTSTMVRTDHRHKDGSLFPVEVSITCLTIDSRKLFFAAARHISERLATEQAMRRLNAELEHRVAERTHQWRESADLLQAVMDGAADAIFVKDLKGRFLLFNRAAARFAGRAIADVLGKTARDIFGEEAGDQIHRYEGEVMRSGVASTIEEVMPGRDEPRLFLATRSPYRDDNGHVIGLIGISRDITEKRSAEEALRDSEARWQFALDGSGDGVWDWNVRSGRVFYSRQWKRMLGYGDDEVGDTTNDWSDRIHPEDMARCWETIKEHFQGDAPVFTIEHRMRAKDGSWRWIFDRGKVVERDEHGEPLRVIGTHTDITERRAAQDALQASYESLRRAERLALIGSWSFDLATGEFSCSDMLHEMIGIDPSGPPLRLADIPRFLNPAGFELLDTAMKRCLDTGEAYGVDVQHLRVDGSRFAAYIRGQPNRDASGALIGVSGTVQDVTEREEARLRLAALADNLPNGAIYRLEHDGRGQYVLTYVSAGIQALIGVPAEEIINDREAFIHAIHEDDIARYQAAVTHSLETRTVFDCEFRARSRNGNMIWMQCRSAPRQMGDGTTVWDGIMRDITVDREIAQSLKAAKETAEAAERAKSDFLAMMSHEIRTPMNTVIGMTHLTLHTELAPRQRNYLEKVDASAKTLLAIINDVLDFSKIEAGRLELEDVAFTLESVLESVSAISAMRAEEKGIEIVYAVLPDVPRRLRGDPLRLGQVLTNLVGNAVKFTHRGEVVVTVGRPADSGDGSPGRFLEFTVRDTGIGLTKAQIAGLFRPFVQAETHTARQYGGTGLGLAISKQIIEQMGGTIAVESQPGEGSVFRFTVALRLPVERDGEGTPFLRQADLAGRRVLIVDDNASARTIMSAMVEGFGMRTAVAASGPEALADLRAASTAGAPFDLVLMDWRMPTMDGLETARQIRADASIGYMPAVLMVTAYGREEVLQQIEAINLQGLLLKPVTESVMFNTILETLVPAAAAQSMAGNAGDGLSGESEPRAEHIARLAGRRVLVVDDNPLNREVACGYITAAGMHADVAGSGIEALAQLERTAFDAVLMDVHMPDMDGLEATRAIRRNPRWIDLPIIALTAQARVEDRAASLDAGMTAHLTKPIDEAVLYGTLNDVIADRAFAAVQTPSLGETAASPPTPDSDARPLAPSALDLVAIFRRFGNDHDRVERLLRGFIRDFADASDQLADHLATQDFARAGTLAHMVKGAASYLSAATFCAAADHMERMAEHDHGATADAAAAFSAELQELLAEVRNGLAQIEAAGARNEALNPAAALVLIGQLAPLVSRGDYAADLLLQTLSKLLAGHETADLLAAARLHFDELELDEASAVLQRLATRLEAMAEPATQ